LDFLQAFPKSSYRVLWFFFSLSQTVVALVSLFFYFRDFQEVNEAIGNNASIDIIGNMSHIYFGFMLAFSVLLCGYLFLRFVPIVGNWEKWVWASLTLVNLICLHILTSRTGLVTFYVGLLVLTLWFVVKNQKIWLIWLAGALFLILPVLSYQLIPSFRQRIDVSIWDVQQFYYESETVANYSLAMRLYAWKTGWELFLGHPWTGVGIADIEDEMIRSGIELFPKEKLLDNPHNQYIENAAAFGVIGLLWLGWILAYSLRKSLLRQASLSISFLAMYATGMVFESLLERQVGICLLCFFVYLLLDFQNTESQQPT
jgi:O-antigen ligase